MGKMSNVIHPGHYRIPGRKECIEEMIDVYGYEKVEAFCEVNMYKYNYRYEMKNGLEDLQKADRYDEILRNLIINDPRYQIGEYFGLNIQMQQLIEEMAELTQAICKHFRGYEIEDNLIEEVADVKLMIDQVIGLLNCEDQVQGIIKQKIKRTLERIEVQKNEIDRIK